MALAALLCDVMQIDWVAYSGPLQNGISEVEVDVVGWVWYEYRGAPLWEEAGGSDTLDSLENNWP